MRIEMRGIHLHRFKKKRHGSLNLPGLQRLHATKKLLLRGFRICCGHIGHLIVGRTSAERAMALLVLLPASAGTRRVSRLPCWPRFCAARRVFGHVSNFASATMM